MRPLLALQGCVGPIQMHTLTRSLAQEQRGLAMPLEEAAVRLAEAWVEVIRPTAR